MILQSLFFYLFSFVTIGSALMVIASRNPVHSVLFLILAFFTAAALFVLMGAEFLGLILIVVYVGAVAVLFLIVVMMLDVDNNKKTIIGNGIRRLGETDCSDRWIYGNISANWERSAEDKINRNPPQETQGVRLASFQP